MSISERDEILILLPPRVGSLQLHVYHLTKPYDIPELLLFQLHIGIENPHMELALKRHAIPLHPTLEHRIINAFKVHIMQLIFLLRVRDVSQQSVVFLYMLNCLPQRIQCRSFAQTVFTLGIQIPKRWAKLSSSFSSHRWGV